MAQNGIQDTYEQRWQDRITGQISKSLEIQADDEVVMHLENGSIRMTPLRQAVNLAQKAVRQYVPQGTSLVDALIQARNDEAGHE